MITIKLLLIVCSLFTLFPSSWSQYFDVHPNPCKCRGITGQKFTMVNGVVCNWDYVSLWEYYTGESMMYVTMPFGSCWSVLSGDMNCICSHGYGTNPFDFSDHQLMHYYFTFELPQSAYFGNWSWIVLEWPKFSRCQNEVGDPVGKYTDGRSYAFEINQVNADFGSPVSDPSRRWCAIYDLLLPWTPGVPCPEAVRYWPVGYPPYTDCDGNPYVPPSARAASTQSQSETFMNNAIPPAENQTDAFLYLLNQRQSRTDEELLELETQKAYEALDSDDPRINKEFVQAMIDRKNLTRPGAATSTTPTDPLA